MSFLLLRASKFLLGDLSNCLRDSGERVRCFLSFVSFDVLLFYIVNFFVFFLLMGIRVLVLSGREVVIEVVVWVLGFCVDKGRVYSDFLRLGCLGV